MPMAGGVRMRGPCCVYRHQVNGVPSVLGGIQGARGRAALSRAGLQALKQWGTSTLPSIDIPLQGILA